MFKKIAYLLMFFLICSYSCPIFATDSIYVWSDTSNIDTISTAATITNQEGNFLNLTCGGAVLIEQSTGTILYEHNSHEQLRPASVTKIMTILLIMEALDKRNYISRR